MKTTQDEILSNGEQGPAGPPGPTTAAALVTAAQAMNGEQRTALLTALGFPTYAGRAVANATAGVANGDVFIDSTDGGRPKIATE